jgi:hypothetical protein
MKALNFFSFLIILLSCFSSALTSAQTRGSYPFIVIEGKAVVTPARCITNPCVSTTASLSGSFIGFLPGNASQLFFTSSSVTTSPDVGFELPQDPNEDSGGTNREATFTFDGNFLKVTGTVDSRAFDGPLIEYFLVAKVDTTHGEEYFTARPDYRKCVSPLCGGYFVKSVNKRLTPCADGTRQLECYVASISYGAGTLDEGQSFSNRTPLLLLGNISSKEFNSFGNLGIFIAKAVYQSATQTSATERFFSIENNGIVCITSPCFSYDQNVLNSSIRTISLSNINLEKTGASADLIEQAQSRLASGEPLLASGKNHTYKGFAGIGVEFVAQQFYLPVKPAATTCEKGYEFSDGACRTPYGCKFPELELTGYGGAPYKDPITGEITSSITKSCVKECVTPAFISGPGQCKVYYP